MARKTSSNATLRAVVGQMNRSKQKQEWLSFSAGATEIGQSLKLDHEPAAMTLYGLCATGNVRSRDRHGNIVDVEECTIDNFEGTVADAKVSANDLRRWLSAHSSTPQRSHLNAVIAEMLKAGAIPGRNIKWDKFCDDVREKCKGEKSVWGLGDKTIKRAVKDLRQS